MIDEGTIQFRSHDGCITTLQGVRHVSESRYNLISLGALHREGFYFSSKGDLMKVFKEARVMFQAERVGNVYMFRNLEVTIGDCSYPRLQDRGYGTIRDYDGFELECLISLQFCICISHFPTDL